MFLGVFSWSRKIYSLEFPNVSVSISSFHFILTLFRIISRRKETFFFSHADVYLDGLSLGSWVDYNIITLPRFIKYVRTHKSIFTVDYT